MTPTSRQKKVLRELATHGLSDKAIAEVTDLPLNAVKTDIRSMCSALGFTREDKCSRVQLAIWGRRSGYGGVRRIPHFGRVK